MCLLLVKIILFYNFNWLKLFSLPTLALYQRKRNVLDFDEINFMLSAFLLFIVLKDVLVKTSPSDVLEVANQMLTTTLIKNFAKMDHATKRNSVSVKHPVQA